MPGSRPIRRRQFLAAVTGAVAVAPVACSTRVSPVARERARKPNVVFVFADQWRAQAAGYAGDASIRTPNLDRLAGESVNFTNAVSCCPVCSPYRASLITGCYPLTHGVFLNDVCLGTGMVSIAEAFNDAGYTTGYIGKWHLDGHGRSNYIPPERRHGFQFWKALECTHDYNNSHYYADDDTTKRTWDGYDAVAQTREAQRYIREHAGDGPFALFLSWGPPHNPYDTPPAEYRQYYDPAGLVLRPNVPDAAAAAVRKDLVGYYAHCSALDACVGALIQTLKENAIEEHTVFVFTSDHGDMLGSQGERRKQRPWDESIRVPFLLRYPARLGRHSRSITTPLNTPDIMPTLLSLCGVEIPRTVEGRDRAALALGAKESKDNAALIACYAPFGEWTRAEGGREYRGVRTPRFTYVRDLEGPWLLYDNRDDPHQMANLAGQASVARVQADLDAVLARKLAETRDAFLPADAYIRKWNHVTDKNGTVPYAP